MHDRYESMLPRLAEYAQRHRGAYRVRVVVLASLGYGVVVLLAAATLISLRLTLPPEPMWKLLLPATLGLILLEALSIHPQAPRGMVLARREAPALWAEIERVRRAMGAPAPHQVLIGEEMKVSMWQVPRLGVLGFYRTYLSIGLPLAAALTADEMRALLAYEYARVARRHGGLAVWIHRIHQTWRQVLTSVRVERARKLIPFRAFVLWYAPFLTAYTTILRREHEFEADREAARVAGTDALAAALCRLCVARAFDAQAFWPGVFRGTEEGTHAPADVFRRMLDQAPGAAGHPSAPAWLAAGAGHSTRPRDSHPSLGDRLAALGVAPELPASPAEPSAADTFFGEDAARLADRLSRRWVEANQYNWHKQHDDRLRLGSLESRAAAEPLPLPEARERIQLTGKLYGTAAAIPLMREYLAAGEDPDMHLMLGELLLDGDDEAGLVHLERAMALNPLTTPAACWTAARFLRARGRIADAKGFERRAKEHEKGYHRAIWHQDAERNVKNLRPTDRFLPHGLSEEHVQALSTQLSRVHGLKRALLVRKEVSVNPAVPFFVLAVEPWKKEEDSSSSNLAERVFMLVKVPGGSTLLIVEATGRHQRLQEPIAQVPGAEVFRAPAPTRAGAG